MGDAQRAWLLTGKRDSWVGQLLLSGVRSFPGPLPGIPLKMGAQKSSSTNSNLGERITNKQKE